MAGSIVDASELTAYAAVLRAAGEDALNQGAKIIAKGALNVKNDARRLAPSGGHAVHYPASISYDTTSGADWTQAEVGPVEGRRQRGLGNLLEYGGPHNPPHPHHEPAADAEEPRLYSAAEDLAARLIERHSR
jgi:hypothetical protein